MTSKRLRKTLQANQYLILWTAVLSGIVAWLLLDRLAALTPGVSGTELQAATALAGWHGIYQQPLDLPLKLVRSVVFYVFPSHGQLLTRLPNIMFGGLAVCAYGCVVWLWHGTRTAVLSTLLFACSAWILHVSRLASFDVLYLWAIPTLVLTHMLLNKHSRRPVIWYGSLLVWGMLLYIPGMVWLLVLAVWLRRQAIASSLRHFKRWWQRCLSGLLVLLWLPLLIVDLLRPGQLIAWLGFPQHLAAFRSLAKQFIAVPVHLFIRGPQYPEVWLDRAPLLDIFTLAACLLGIYFYVRHWQASRSRLLGTLFAIGLVLIGLGGPVGLSILVPVVYFSVATGLAFLTHEWLRVFPNNPLARSLGVGLIVAAVGLSCLYNIRAYFVAWPHTAATRSAFHYHIEP